MSILLDALRKSERRERLGAAPDIHADDAPSPPPDRPRWLLPALAVLVLVGLIGGGYAAWRWGWSTPPVPVAPPELPMETAQTDPPPPAVAGDRQATPVARTTDAAPTGSGSAGDPPRSPVESLSGERPYRPASASSTSEAEPIPGSATDVANERSERLATAMAHAGAGATPPPAVPAERAESRPEPTVQARNDTGLISYWQLPPGTRENLPDFRINVMVYDEDPEARFIIMGGKRYREGDQLKKSLNLEEIRRDRTVFRYGVYRFYVKQ